MRPHQDVNEMTREKKVAFILSRYPLGVSSMIINSIRLFAHRGFSVDIHINKKAFDASPLNFNEDHIQTVVFDDGISDFFLKGYRFLVKCTGNSLYPVTQKLTVPAGLMTVFPDIYFFSRWLAKQACLGNYDYIFPVECNSLLSLYHIRNWDNVVYYNMELLDWSSDNPLYRNKLTLKNLEHRLIQRLQHVVLPSHSRAESFCRINDFDIRKTHILPVTAMGNPIQQRSRYFRKKFNIPDNHIVVLYSGNFQPWFQCREMITAMKSCRIPYTLVMHTWNSTAKSTPYFREMTKQAKGLPVFFSDEYIPYDHLSEALSSADIGLAFYDSIDDNFTEIMFSSNKMGEYFKAGLPVVCSDYPSLKKFILENRVGVPISVQETAGAVEDIADHLDEYRINTLQCYQDKFRFETYFDHFIHDLLQAPRRNNKC